MRYLGVDFGRRRIGLALSDDTALLATPWRSVSSGGTPAAAARAVQDIVAAAATEPDGGIGALVVGLPRRLNGEETDLTPEVRTFAAALEAATGLAVHLQDERLSSREAESRLAERDRDWRRRKLRLDAAAAAIILQDFLDSRRDAQRRVESDLS